MEWIFTDINTNFIGHGFLAVDFFFCLSGFVTGYAYDNRIGKIGLKEFFTSRLIRLHPLVALGAVLGLLGFLIDPFAAPSSLTVGKIALLFLSAFLLVPLPIMEERFFNLFAFNAPAWSLFWEYVANIAYALVLCRLGRKALGLLTLLTGATLCYLAFRAGVLAGGWSKDTFLHGMVRVAYSFTAGLFVFRSNWIIKNNIGFVGLAIVLSLAFIMPGSAYNWLTESIAVVLFFPLIVSLGAGSTLSTRLTKICRFSGDISYPLYMTHYAAIWIFGNYYVAKNPTAGELTFIIVTGTFLLVGFAYIVMRFYDVPIRAYLNKKRMNA